MESKYLQTLLECCRYLQFWPRLKIKANQHDQIGSGSVDFSEKPSPPNILAAIVPLSSVKRTLLSIYMSRHPKSGSTVAKNR